MTAILLSIAILLALLLGLLAVPVKVAFRIDRIHETTGHVNFGWLFGLVRFRIAIPGTVDTESQRKRRPAKKQQKKIGNPRGVFVLLKQPAFRQRTIRFIKNVLRAVHPRDLYLRLRIGLGDPADTGRLWVILGPAAGIAANLRGAEVRIEPEFMDPALEVESHGEFRLVPLQFIALTIVFVLSLTTLRAYRTLRQSSG